MLAATVLFAAALKMLAPFSPASWSNVALPEKFEETATAAEEAVFAQVDVVVDASRRRSELWMRYVGLMQGRESQPSTASVRFRMSVGRRIYLFTDMGRLFLDGRFVKGDETQALLAVERVFAATFARSPYARLVKLRTDPAGRAVDTPSGAMFVPAFHGFEDARYQRLDSEIARVASESSAAGRVLPPALLKSLLVEMRCWDFDSPELDEAHVRSVAHELSSAVEGGFSGWELSLASLIGRRIGANAGRRYCVDFAARVTARASNPDEFVPVLGRNNPAGQPERKGNK